MHTPTQSVKRPLKLLPAPGAEQRFVYGGVRRALQLEAFAAFGAATAIYGWCGFSRPAFALLFLAPDLSMLAYFAGPRIGALAYNIAHSAALALSLTVAGFFGSLPMIAAAGLIWIAHIGIDRAFGYGLKYPTRFGDTHLGSIGRH
ncbi:MAG: DUF4260 family protein [Hyphomicrobiales bacterium]|nr:DUF4260 family protein [Hyphomicrobiales bacterium]